MAAVPHLVKMVCWSRDNEVWWWGESQPKQKQTAGHLQQVPNDGLEPGVRPLIGRGEVNCECDWQRWLERGCGCLGPLGEHRKGTAAAVDAAYDFASFAALFPAHRPTKTTKHDKAIPSARTTQPCGAHAQRSKLDRELLTNDHPAEPHLAAPVWQQQDCFSFCRNPQPSDARDPPRRSCACVLALLARLSAIRLPIGLGCVGALCLLLLLLHFNPPAHCCCCFQLRLSRAD